MDNITQNPPYAPPPLLTEGVDLAALVASRICHDLISPLGAISNGVELLMMEEEGARPEIALIAESVASATAKVKFLRLALGPSQAGQVLGLTQIQAILAENFDGNRLQVQWLVPQGLPRSEVRQAFLGLMCLQHALPVGGLIEVRQHDSLWQLTATAKRMHFDPALWPLLTQMTPQHRLEAQHVQFALLRDSLQERAGLAELALANDSATLRWRHSA